MNKIKFSQFEQQYEIASIKIEEGAIDGLKNFFSKLFGGKVHKLDTIIKSIKNADNDYWKEWSDFTFKYNAAYIIRNQTSNQVEHTKQDEIMNRIKKTKETLNAARETYKQSLDKQASLIIGENTRLKDYYNMEKAKMEAEVAQHSYEDVRKISDEKLIDEAYKRLNDKLAKVKKHDIEFKEKYGDNYQKNLFGMTDHDFGKYEHGFTDNESSNLDTYLLMTDRAFAYAISRMNPDDAYKVEELMQTEMKQLKEDLEKHREDSKLRIDAAEKEKDQAAIKREKDQAHYKELDIVDKMKSLSKKIGALAGFTSSGFIRKY